MHEQYHGHQSLATLPERITAASLVRRTFSPAALTDGVETPPTRSRGRKRPNSCTAPHAGPDRNGLSASSRRNLRRVNRQPEALLTSAVVRLGPASQARYALVAVKLRAGCPPGPRAKDGACSSTTVSELHHRLLEPFVILRRRAPPLSRRDRSCTRRRLSRECRGRVRRCRSR